MRGLHRTFGFLLGLSGGGVGTYAVIYEIWPSVRWCGMLMLIGLTFVLTDPDDQ